MKITKITKISILLLCLLLTLTGCTPQSDEPAESARGQPVTTTETERPRNNNTEAGSGENAFDNGAGITGVMEISVFGIGRSDAIVITTENYTVMIDTGERRHGPPIVHHLFNRGISRIDYLIITHFDRDHVGGAYIIINYTDVKKVIVPNYSRDSNHVNRFEAALRANGLEAYVLTETMRFTLDNIEFTVDPSRLEYVHFARYTDEHELYFYEAGGAAAAEETAAPPSGDDFSIVVSVTHGYNRFLFTGDAMAARLQELLENEEIMNTGHDFLKMPRHGRHNARSIEFIHAVSPRYAVITGFHPSDLARYYPERPADERVIAALDSVGAEVYFAMSTGVHVKSDGYEIGVTYRNFFAG